MRDDRTAHETKMAPLSSYGLRVLKYKFGNRLAPKWEESTQHRLYGLSLYWGRFLGNFRVILIPSIIALIAVAREKESRFLRLSGIFVALPGFAFLALTYAWRIRVQPPTTTPKFATRLLPELKRKQREKRSANVRALQA